MASPVQRSSAVSELLGALRADEPRWLDDAIGEITAAIHAELPELGADEDLAAGTLVSTDSVVRLVVEALDDGLPVDGLAPPPPAVDYARELVRRGLPLDTLLRAYFTGHGVFSRRWNELCRENLTPHRGADAIEAGSALTFDALAALTRGLVQRYGEERERWLRSATAVRVETVRELLADEPVDAQAAESRLGYPLERHHVALVVWHEAGGDVSGDLAALERVAVELLDPLDPGARLVVPLGNHVVAAWAAFTSGQEAVRAARAVRTTPAAGVAAGGEAAGLEGFARSHREALHARRVARLGGPAATGTTRYGDVALLALATADVEHARSFAAAELGALGRAGPEAQELRATLLAYVEEHLSPRRTARRLGVHENTVANRVKAAEALLGRAVDARAPELLVALRLVAALA